MALVRIGRVGRAHGLNGEVTLDGASLTAPELLAVHSFTWRGSGGETLSLKLETARPANRRILVGFLGFADRDRASILTGGELLAEAERLPDPGPDHAYAFQIIGLEVRTEDGRLLGTVADVISTGPQPIYIVRGERELLIPVTPEVVRRVDLERGLISVSLPPGLEEL